MFLVCRVVWVFCILFIFLDPSYYSCLGLPCSSLRQIKGGKDMEYETNNFNPRVPNTFDSAPNTIAPPPLPPRGRFYAGFNYQAQHANLPTVEVQW